MLRSNIQKGKLQLMPGPRNIMAAIGFKVLRVSHDTMAKRTAGHMVNLLSTDGEKLIWFTQYIAFIVVSPLQLAIIAWLCYEILGIPAIIGLIIIVLVLPCQGLKIMFLLCKQTITDCNIFFIF